MNNNPGSSTNQSTHEFAIIETDDGFTVVMLQPNVPAEQTALQHSGILMDPGPYRSYDDAYDAIVDLIEQREERE